MSVTTSPLSPLILALDTVGEATSAALLAGDGRILAVDERAERMGQSEFVLPMLDAVCAKAGVALKDVTHLVAATGPGSFTGVRVGLAALQGLARALNCPLVGIDRFSAIGAFLEPQASGAAVGGVLASFREELYVSLDGQVEMLTAPEILARLGTAPWVLAGEAVAELEALPPSVRVADLPQGAVLIAQKALALLTAGADLPPAVPLYIREPDISVPRAAAGGAS